MTVVLVPIVAEFGVDGVLVVGIMAGVLLVGLAYAGAGRYMRYIPLPVVEGFTVGIAVIIALQQVPAALGVTVTAPGVLAGAAEAVGALLAAPNSRRSRSRAPWSRSWLSRPASARDCPSRSSPSLPRASSRRWPTSRSRRSARSLQGLPTPSLPPIQPGTVGSLLVPAIAVAALAALESLMSATVADGMSVGERHDSDRELFGQGIANLVTPLFGGIPATAAIARTAVNVRSGGRSRLAAITQSLALLAVVLVASQWVASIPLAALAGVLLATALQMVEASSLVALLRSTRGDAAALVITAGATIVLDLVTAVILA